MFLNKKSLKKMENKIEKSIELIKKGEKVALSLDPAKGYHVAFSGGKDSQAVLELVKMAGVKYTAIYNVTGIDSPTTIHFMQQYYPEVIFSHPKENFFRLVEKKGLPTIMRRHCCERIKELSDSGCVVLTGVRAEESRKRAKYKQTMIMSRRKENKGVSKTIDEIEKSEHRCIKGKDKILMHPILDWTLEDVLSFIELRGLRLNPSYMEVERVGCMICPFAKAEQMERFEERYPGYKKRLLLALHRYWDKTDTHYDNSPEDYYERWKRKVPIKK